MKRILVADDKNNIVQGISQMLSNFCEVDTATTGFDVKYLFARKEYDGLIIDVAFDNGMNGLEIAGKLRAKHRNLIIIVFSATDYSDAIRQQAVDIGATFKQKPLELDDIRNIMGI